MRSKPATISSRRKRGSIPPSMSALPRNASGRSFSAMLKPMKSTSSRFSFDMVGSANEEKLLEERHRQKQQDKQDEVQDNGYRDSRYDEFDEDFDYDNMLDDVDDFEERIPGVNADFEEDDGFGGIEDEFPYDHEDLGLDLEEQDPDNDQSNFGGFVFQRSDPNSLVASPLGPAPLLTPRDAGGNVIGYASAGMTPTFPPASALDANAAKSNLDEELVPKPLRNSQQMGLGIHGSKPSSPAHFEDVGFDEKMAMPTDPAPARHLDPDDELCFKTDDFSGEGDGNAFDESLFDLDDTDQYGRPIPGAFASALAQRHMGPADGHNRESEGTSRLSAQTVASQSTADTSVSLEVREQPRDIEAIGKGSLPVEQAQQRPEASAAEKEQLAAYQAALAAAAYRAAASGKFDRESPGSPVDLMRHASIAASSVYSTEDQILDSIEDYEAEDDAFASLDDYELDDDAIIAEANASALANDSDGWYGQEFGFFAAPSQQHHLVQQQKSSKSLTEQNLYQYSAGGFFGPSGGLERSMSGHAVLREPNLTPITERSEYSNRNSIMSLGIPPGIGSAPIQSPGLAQLAMMADDDDMTLSALLRLRSKAWGGSQASLNSREGSPHERNGASSPWSPEPSSSFLGLTSPAQGRKNSAYSLWSQDSAGPGSSSGSPTITLAAPIMPNNMTMPPLVIPQTDNTAVSPSLGAGSFASPPPPSSACPPVFEDDETDEVPTTASISNSSSIYVSSSGGDMMPPPPPPARQTSNHRPAMSHRHRNSADSISYTKEEDSGETRWVVERRRTAESGEMELLGREIIHGGRI
ncbi:hypothetical protein Micbo1qcDRAFT_155763 [Microdochium bolleyi]|uniref:Uncharacterized protein n=1 Tax=Microdochium bolleyi TaxID=196109 RepID=A0A136JIP8_9PEZI|nr:hypothetical protein Micbo1qcDRAFT_155763 [Microdochium bolleyi]